MDKRATFQRDVIEHLCVRKRDGPNEKERNGSISYRLSTFERFVTGVRL